MRVPLSDGATAEPPRLPGRPRARDSSLAMWYASVTVLGEEPGAKAGEETGV